MEFRFKRPIANLSRRRKRIYTYRNHVRWMIHVLTFPFRAKCMRIKFAPETGYAPRYQSLTRKPFDEKIPYCNLISRTDVNCIRANRFLPLSLCLVSFDKLLRKLSINSKGWGDRFLKKIWRYAICKEHLSFNGTGTWEEEREEKKLGAESMVVVRRYRSGGRDPQCHFYAGVWVRVCVEIGVARSPPRSLEWENGSTVRSTDVFQFHTRVPPSFSPYVESVRQ